VPVFGRVTDGTKVPRKPRFFLPDVPAHVVQRGNNRQPVFYEESDYRAYREWLVEGAQRYGCAVHAYVLMTNHVHLLLTPQERDSASRLLQYVGRRYVPYVNHKYGRTGTLWEGRFKASIVDASQYLLSCYRYIELNPVRAGMVDAPSGYRWSSYRANAQGVGDPVVSPHHMYLGLGEDDQTRRSAYRRLFRGHVGEQHLDEIRGCLQTGTPLGNDRFREGIEQALKVKVGHARRGRPKRRERSTPEKGFCPFLL
jgi:putative transposase